MATTDLDKLQGSWAITAIEADGQELAVDTLQGAKVEVRGTTFKSFSMGATYEGRITLDATKKPKRFDLLFTAGPETGNKNLGIYRLVGDRWTICLATRGTRRPPSFATKPNTGLALETLEREGARGGRAANAKGGGKGAKRPRPPLAADERAAAEGPVTELEGNWQMVAATFNGAPMDESAVKWCKRMTHGSLTTVVAGPQTMLKARFSLDRSKKPNAIDYVNLGGGKDAGKSQLGIMELASGVLKICMAAPGKPRPGEFGSTRGDGRSFTTWKLIEE